MVLVLATHIRTETTMNDRKHSTVNGECKNQERREGGDERARGCLGRSWRVGESQWLSAVLSVTR